MLGADHAVDVLEALARYQGTTDDPRTGEARGKVLHELRTGDSGVFGLAPWQPYFGSVDATPLFVMLLAEAWRWGRGRCAGTCAAARGAARGGVVPFGGRGRPARARDLRPRHRGPGQPRLEDSARPPPVGGDARRRRRRGTRGPADGGGHGWRVGLRTLSSTAVGYDPLSYHRGSIWPHDTALVADGIARAGRRPPRCHRARRTRCVGTMTRCGHPPGGAAASRQARPSCQTVWW